MVNSVVRLFGARSYIHYYLKIIFCVHECVCQDRTGVSSRGQTRGTRAGLHDNVLTDLLPRWGDGLAQYIVRALDWRSKGRGFESLQEHKNNLEFFRIKKVVLTPCRCMCPTPRVHTHAYERPCTHIKHPVVHVRVRWMMETRK